MRVREGAAEIEVPGEKPEETRKFGFFNPEMRENRDIAVASLNVLGSAFPERKVLDAFSATGIRAIRYCKETAWEPVASEVNENAFSLLMKNMEANRCKFRAEMRDCKMIMMEEKFQAIDIDPYGSPAQFIYPAFSGLDKSSILMVTATDTANLFGVYPRKSFRLYGYRGVRNFSQKEMGVRMLLSFIIRTGAMLGKAYVPLVSYSHKHYVRVIGIVRRSKREANRMLSMFDWVGNELYYMGSLHDKDFVRKLAKEINSQNYADTTRRLVMRISEELDAPLYYDTHDYGSVSLKKAREMIEAAGGKFSRTHFSPTCFKTNLSREEVEKILGGR